MESVKNYQPQQLQDYQKSLIPLWVKVVGWPLIFFSVFTSIVMAISLLIGDTSDPLSIGIYGVFYKGSAFHPIPIGLTILLLANAITGYRLLLAKPNAVPMCLYTAYFTLGVIIMGKLKYPTNYFPFEPFVSVLYIVTLHRLQRLYQRET